MLKSVPLSMCCRDHYPIKVQSKDRKLGQIVFKIKQRQIHVANLATMTDSETALEAAIRIGLGDYL